MQNASIVACATKEENDLKVARAFRRRREKSAKYLMRENCLRCDLCAIEPMSMNSARAGIPCAARRRPLEAMAELEKFPTLVYPKPALKRCGFCRSWPSVHHRPIGTLASPMLSFQSRPNKRIGTFHDRITTSANYMHLPNLRFQQASRQTSPSASGYSSRCT
jgi:hypothetical protein